MRALLQIAQTRLGLVLVSPRILRLCALQGCGSAGQQLHPRALGGDGDVEGVGLVRRSGGGAQSVIEGAHEEATRLQMADTRNSVW